MAHVSLDDDELMEMLLERPHVIAQAIQKLQRDLLEHEGCYTSLFNINMDLRKKIRDLEKDG